MDAFTLVAKLVLNRDEFDSGMSQVESDLGNESKLGGFKNAGAAIGRVLAKAATAAFNAAADFGKSAIETGMSFDYMMAKVKAVSGQTDKDFEKVRKRALELGETTEWTAEQVGEAFYYMGLAGWKTEEMMNGIEPILNLATAAGEDLGRTSDIVTDALTAMGYEAKDAAYFANVLTAASMNSNTTVSQLGEAFKYLATTGGVLGYSIDDVAKTLGLLANNGIKASQAGTSMRKILNTLIAPTEDAEKAMRALGISLFDYSGENGTVGARKPLMQVVQELRQVFKDADFDLKGKPLEEVSEKIDALNAEWDEEYEKLKGEGASKSKIQEAYDAYLERFKGIVEFNADFLGKLSDIGGLRGISSLFALMQSTDDDVNQLNEAVAKSNEGEGAAKTAAETMLDNLKGDITLLNSALDGLKILVSDEYNEKIRKFVQEITGGIGDISAAFKEGGAAEAFASLTDWIINGITDTLTNPDITQDGARNFGKALGDFVGHLVSTLVKNAPEIMGGLFQAGINLAGGLVEGLFAGLFGTGAGTVYAYMEQAGEERDDLIKDANKTAVEAQGIVSYMDSLVQKYGDAATKSAEWADALNRLETLIPGITEHISAEGQTLKETTEQLRGYVEAHKEKLIQDAKEAYLGDLQSKYLQAQIDLGQAQTEQMLYQSQKDAAIERIIEMYRQQYGSAFTAEIEARQRQLLQEGNLAGLDANVQFSPENGLTKAEVEGVYESYKEALKKLEGSSENITKLEEEASVLSSQLTIAEAAVESMAKQAEAVDTGGLNTATANATNALNNMADEANSFSASGSGYGQAKGDWYVPYDNYPSLLHRGEMVLTASQARRYREGDSNMNTESFAAAVVSAIRQGMENAQVNAYMDGRKVSEEVSRNMNSLLMEGRYA